MRDALVKMLSLVWEVSVETDDNNATWQGHVSHRDAGGTWMPGGGSSGLSLARLGRPPRGGSILVGSRDKTSSSLWGPGWWGGGRENLGQRAQHMQRQRGTAQPGISGKGDQNK